MLYGGCGIQSCYIVLWGYGLPVEPGGDEGGWGGAVEGFDDDRGVAVVEGVKVGVGR